MQLELWQYGNLISSVTLNLFQIGDRKQGYSATVIPGLDHTYKLSLTGGGNVPSDWIIEFSDPIFGNRWKRDEIHLIVAGRNCSYPVHSQHDRRLIFEKYSFRHCNGFFSLDTFGLERVILLLREEELAHLFLIWHLSIVNPSQN